MKQKLKDTFLVLGLLAVYGPRMIANEIRRRMERREIL